MALFTKKISAVKVPHHKNTAAVASVVAPPPPEVLIPTNMQSGDACADRLLRRQAAEIQFRCMQLFPALLQPLNPIS